MGLFDQGGQSNQYYGQPSANLNTGLANPQTMPANMQNLAPNNIAIQQYMANHGYNSVTYPTQTNTSSNILPVGNFPLGMPDMGNGNRMNSNLPKLTGPLSSVASQETSGNIPMPDVGITNPSSSFNPAFYDSQQYKDFQDNTSSGIGTMDIYDSPYFGMQHSGSIGKAQDDAYESFLSSLKNTQTPTTTPSPNQIDMSVMGGGYDPQGRPVDGNGKLIDYSGQKPNIQNVMSTFGNPNNSQKMSFNGVPNMQAPTSGQTMPTQNPYGTNPYLNSTNPYIQAANATASGNINAANAATAANRVNQNTPYGSLQYSQTGTDANGNPIWSANQTLSQPLENLTNKSLSNLQSSLENPAYGINPGQTYSDAIMSRLQPQITHQNEMSDQALANQGIMPGSQAYKNAKLVLGQQQNDLLTSAIVQGMNTGLQAQQLQNTTAANVKNLGTPSYVNPYNQAAVAAPDYLGAYSTANAADIAKTNAQMAQQTAQMNGLLGLGSSALLGGTGTGSVLGAAGTGLNNLFNYFNSLSNPSSGVSVITDPTSPYYTGLNPSVFTNPLSTDTSALDAASQYFTL